MWMYIIEYMIMISNYEYVVHYSSITEYSPIARFLSPQMIQSWGINK